jgi:hypothetical protein
MPFYIWFFTGDLFKKHASRFGGSQHALQPLLPFQADQGGIMYFGDY